MSAFGPQQLLLEEINLARFVKGHDFSRAANTCGKIGALAPEARLNEGYGIQPVH